MSVAAVILAAGSGSRFNGDAPDALPGAKLLALLKGQPVLTWALLPALCADLDEVVVVGGAADLSAVVPESVTLLQNDDWANGLATSLKAGLEWCRAQGHDRAVLGLGDMPGLASAAWRAVATEPMGPIVFATYQGKRGHPVRLDASVWPLLPSSGDEGARSLARERPELVHEVACVGATNDIDTLEDLRKWS
ncbi:MAG TPA: nucleotidyltransferase family protein [Acidimicrobiales bacterium]|nr:nucleotidyltransferase family protein [Acidimicrobiales bacterium]